MVKAFRKPAMSVLTRGLSTMIALFSLDSGIDISLIVSRCGVMVKGPSAISTSCPWPGRSYPATTNLTSLCSIPSIPVQDPLASGLPHSHSFGLTNS
ncbi:hypothetical protein E2C01_098768 [Portunus trituberculatus]|uniref:Uncharacterized protein n=1 Tax=Portunus trituberculatus TaxID=210409 RepID=A0A5B7KEZ7_PORTR|nr:hypothetical protein [Portunus trituberculatus]